MFRPADWLAVKDNDPEEDIPMYFIARDFTNSDPDLFMCLLVVFAFGALFVVVSAWEWLKRQLAPPKPPENAHTED